MTPRARSLKDLLPGTGPWYGLASAEPMRRSVGGHGLSNDDLTSLSLAHELADAFIAVETDTSSFELSAAEMEWDAIRDVLMFFVDRGPVSPVPTEEFVEPDPPSYPIAIEMRRIESNIPVDGTPVPFVCVGDASRWVGWARIAGRLVKVRAWNQSPALVALETVDPVSAYEVPTYPDEIVWGRRVRRFGWRRRW